MKIKELKEILQKANNEATVYFDFGECFPTTVASWRGIYEEPSIGWSSTSGYRPPYIPPTVKVFLDELDYATSGMMYGGYKGGEYSFSDEQTLHVDNYGICSYTEIIGVDIHEYFVVLNTRRVK